MRAPPVSRTPRAEEYDEAIGRFGPVIESFARAFAVAHTPLDREEANAEGQLLLWQVLCREPVDPADPDRFLALLKTLLHRRFAKRRALLFRHGGGSWVALSDSTPCSAGDGLAAFDAGEHWSGLVAALLRELPLEASVVFRELTTPTFRVLLRRERAAEVLIAKGESRRARKLSPAYSPLAWARLVRDAYGLSAREYAHAIRQIRAAYLRVAGSSRP